MILTTTQTVEGRTITEYMRIIGGETITGMNMFKDIGAGFRNITGGRSSAYEGEILQARETALKEMVDRALEMGAHGIVGVDVDYESLGQGGMVMVSATGTAVTFQ